MIVAKRRHAADALRDLSSKYPEVDGNIVHFKFKVRGQRETPVTLEMKYENENNNNNTNTQFGHPPFE